jgi:hypothetical protein
MRVPYKALRWRNKVNQELFPLICESCGQKYYSRGHWADHRVCPLCSSKEYAELERIIDAKNYEAWKHLARDNPNEMPGGVNYKPSWLKYMSRYENELLLRNFAFLPPGKKHEPGCMG